MNTNNSDYLPSIHRFFSAYPIQICRQRWNQLSQGKRIHQDVMLLQAERPSWCKCSDRKMSSSTYTLPLRFTFNMETFKHLYCWVHSSCHSFHHISHWDSLVMRYFFSSQQEGSGFPTSYLAGPFSGLTGNVLRGFSRGVQVSLVGWLCYSCNLQTASPLATYP